MGETLDSLFPDDRSVLLDGAMGSSLRSRGWSRREPTILANLEQPDLVESVHRAHREAGARLITTNTFSALMVSGSKCLEATRVGVQLARRAAGCDGRIAGTVAAFGLAVDDPQLEEIVTALVEEGVDLLVFETCNQLRDAENALSLRRRLAPGIPAVICASTTDGSRADWGRVRDVIGYVQGAGDPQVEAGLNCCRGPYDALRIALSSSPVLRWVKPSTGLPPDRADDSVMAAFARTAIHSRVRYVGGCCGTTPETLGAMAAAMRFPN
jgi:methionine synthase I (cobalamin-dependent)